MKNFTTLYLTSPVITKFLLLYITKWLIATMRAFIEPTRGLKTPQINYWLCQNKINYTVFSSISMPLLPALMAPVGCLKQPEKNKRLSYIIPIIYFAAMPHNIYLVAFFYVFCNLNSKKAKKIDIWLSLDKLATAYILKIFCHLTFKITDGLGRL